MLGHYVATDSIYSFVPLLSVEIEMTVWRLALGVGVVDIHYHRNMYYKKTTTIQCEVSITIIIPVREDNDDLSGPLYVEQCRTGFPASRLPHKIFNRVSLVAME